MLNSYTTLIVLIGVILLSINCTIIGTYNYLQKKSLLADVVAHSILPGICLSFLLTQEKDFLWLFIGAFITGMASIYTIDFIKRASFLGEDTILGIVLSFFFGLGIVLLTYIQNQGFSEQSGLDNFLLGRAASILISDVKIIASVTLILVVTIILLGRLFVAIAFDSAFLSQIGISTKLIQLIISTLTIMTITVGIQAVGIVLIAAIMIIPPAIGRLWSYQVSRIILIGLLASILSSLIGVYISYTFPRSPTGPWIVVGLVGCFLFSLLFGTQSSLKVFEIRKI